MIRKVLDDRKRELLFAKAPQRVISLVPSDTWNVAALGCASALVARTDFCELPADVVSRLPSVGGTKNPRVEAVCDLAPDLVLANQEENTRSDLEAIAQRGFRVFVAFPKRVSEGLAHLAKLARIFDVERDPSVRTLVKEGYEAVRAAEAGLRARAAANTGSGAAMAPLRVFCPIWMDPLMTVNGRTYISDMITLAGGENVFEGRARLYPLAADLGKRAPLADEAVLGRDDRYPRVTLDEVVARAPDAVLLPDEPHPFSEEDAEVFRALAIPAATARAVLRVPGKDLSWYGARCVEGLPRVRALLEAVARARVN